MSLKTPYEARFPKRMYDKLSKVPTKPGIYFISNFMETPSKTERNKDKMLRRVKVGRAKHSLRQRLSDYLLYWPTGVVVYALISTKTEKQSLWLEVFLHNFLRICGSRYRFSSNSKSGAFTAPKHTHLSEWFILDVEIIDRIVQCFFVGRNASQNIQSVIKMLSSAKLIKASDHILK